jgi:hypothetical protein
MKHHLEVTVPDHNSFYTLFANGNHSWKTYDRQNKRTLLYYAPGAVVILYYTYKTHREACVIRNTTEGAGTRRVTLPGLSKEVCRLFSVRASRVDKLKRATGWLNVHSPLAAYGFDDGFYVRLCYLLEQRGKINYPALGKLAEVSSVQNQNNLF